MGIFWNTFLFHHLATIGTRTIRLEAQRGVMLLRNGTRVYWLFSDAEKMQKIFRLYLSVKTFDMIIIHPVYGDVRYSENSFIALIHWASGWVEKVVGMLHQGQSQSYVFLGTNPASFISVFFKMLIYDSQSKKRRWTDCLGFEPRTAGW